MRFIVLFFFILFGFQASFANQKGISVHFQRSPIQEALMWLFQFSSQNVLISPSVKGELTFHVDHVDWKEAVDIVLRSNHLGLKEIGRVLYIAPWSELIQHEKEEREREANLPLQTKIIQLNHSKVEEVSVLLKEKKKELFSRDGYFISDKGSNRLFVQERAERLFLIEKWINSIDLPISQLFITAHIVNIDQRYKKEIGVKFGMLSENSNDNLSGRSQVVEKKLGVTSNKRFHFTIPLLSNHSKYLGVALFKLTKETMLDLELSALEKEGYIDIISSPKLITCDRKTATIEAGEEIPYQEISDQGASTSSFKKAVLSLKVTPHVMPNRKIILDLHMNQDQRSSREINGAPSIDMRQIKTQVTLSDGQTAVLGGIYESTRENALEQMPFLSQCPVIGGLFQRKQESNDRRELFIFITPTIIK